MPNLTLVNLAHLKFSLVPGNDSNNIEVVSVMLNRHKYLQLYNN